MGKLAEPRALSALKTVAGTDASVVLLGLDEVGDEAWEVLAASGLRLVHVADEIDAVRVLTDRTAQVVLADIRRAPALIRAVRADRELATVHIVVCCAAADELRAALDAGADDVMRIPFEPEVLAARVAAGLRAARLRAGEAMLASLVANIPGAVYRCACDEHWTMLWLSDEIEEISGYEAADFIASRVRTFASVIHPDDREQVERSVMDGVDADRPFTIEYRIVRRDGDVRWVLERGQAQEAGDGRRWLDGAIFDVTARRAAEQALREHEIVEATLAEVRASRARILDAADRARREIERNLHDGAQQRLVSAALRLQLWLTSNRDVAGEARTDLEDVLGELRTGMFELRDLAHGLHPAVLTDRGLEYALMGLAQRATVPVELRATLPNGCRSRWNRRPTSSSARPSPTSPSTRTPAMRGSPSSGATAVSRSRSATTASAAWTSGRARAWRDSATASPRSTGRSRSAAHPAAGRSCAPGYRSASSGRDPRTGAGGRSRARRDAPSGTR